MPPSLTLDLITFDPGGPAASAVDFAHRIISTVENSWETGADLVLLPEFMWLGLYPHLPIPPSEPLRDVATLWKELLPVLQERFSVPGKAVVLGTIAPFCQTAGFAIEHDLRRWTDVASGQIAPHALGKRLYLG